MTIPPRPPHAALSRQLETSRNTLAGKGGPTFVRQSYKLPRDTARRTAREWFDRYPKAAYWTAVENWRVLDGDVIEFTMRRLPTAD